MVKNNREFEVSARLEAKVTPRLLPVAQWDRHHEWPSVLALRNMIFRAKANGLSESGAIVRVGKRVLIDEGRFFDWVSKQNGGFRG